MYRLEIYGIKKAFGLAFYYIIKKDQYSLLSPCFTIISKKCNKKCAFIYFSSVLLLNGDIHFSSKIMDNNFEGMDR